MSQKLITSFLILLLVGATLWGAPAIDTQRFKPSIGVSGMVLTDTSEFLDPFTFGGMLYLHYDKDPLTVKNAGDEESALGHVFQSDLVVTFGLPFHIELGVVLPVTLYSSGQNTFDADTGDFSKTSLGDVQFVARYLFPRFSQKIGMGLSLRVTAPTGDETTFNGADGVTATPGFFIDYKVMDKLLVAFNMGYLIKKNVALEDLEQNDEVSFKIGAKYEIVEDLELLMEFYGAFQTTRPFKVREETPLEVLFAANYYYLSDFRFTGGLALGLSPGAGTPLLRVIAGVGYVPRDDDWDKDGIKNVADSCPRKKEDFDGFKDGDGCPESDNDNDGILDAMDKCPNKAEDIDQFEDNDGCPELDNDKDGIEDSKDKCPNKRELFNQIEDEDGCPEIDTDKDGLLDPKDKCPKEAEDKDGFKDEDGCPDLDNDEDGVVDTKDKCPNKAEDKDGFEDLDGCPELDNDQDGIVDKFDKCPNKPENYNGNEDSDGCPDKGKSLVNVNVITNKINIQQKVYFALGSAVIATKSHKLLLTVASILNNNTQIKVVRVEGHTDDLGPKELNTRLSRERAKAVMDFMIKEGKVDPKRLKSEGYGSARPLINIDELVKKRQNKKLSWADRNDARLALKAAREQNRRVDFVIADQ